MERDTKKLKSYALFKKALKMLGDKRPMRLRLKFLFKVLDDHKGWGSYGNMYAAKRALKQVIKEKGL